MVISVLLYFIIAENAAKRMLSETDNSSWCSSLTSEELRSFATLGLRGHIPVICVCLNKQREGVCVIKSVGPAVAGANCQNKVQWLIV